MPNAVFFVNIGYFALLNVKTALLFYGVLEDGFAGFYKFHFGIVLLEEAYHFGRVNAREIHVSLELHSCQLRYVIKSLRVLSSAKREVIAAFLIVMECYVFCFSEQGYGIKNLFPQALGSAGEGLFEGYVGIHFFVFWGGIGLTGPF